MAVGVSAGMESQPSRFQLDGFDESFFANLEQEMQATDMEAVASEALTGILTVKADDGQERSYQDIKQEAEVFFSNPLVAQDMRLLSSLAMQYADFCGNHGFDVDSAMNGGSLGDIYKLGKKQHDAADRRGQTAGRGDYKTSKDSKSKEKKKKNTPQTLYEWFAKYFKKSSSVSSLTFFK